MNDTRLPPPGSAESDCPPLTQFPSGVLAGCSAPRDELAARPVPPLPSLGDLKGHRHSTSYASVSFSLWSPRCQHGAAFSSRKLVTTKRLFTCKKAQVLCRGGTHSGASSEQEQGQMSPRTASQAAPRIQKTQARARGPAPFPIPASCQGSLGGSRQWLR